MRKALSIGIALSIGSFVLGCDSSTFQASETAIQPALQLVSPDGVRIANSVDELTQPSFLEARHGSTKPVTITQISYGWEVGSPPIDETIRNKGGRVTNANIHYKTATGEKGVYFIEVVEP